MQLSRIGKLIVRFVALESIDVTVELSFPGNIANVIYIVYNTFAGLN